MRIGQARRPQFTLGWAVLVALFPLVPAGCGTGPTAACSQDTDCAKGLRCNSGTCVAPDAPRGPCASDQECASPLVCRLGSCVTPRSDGDACTKTEECATGSACRGKTCFKLRSQGDSCNMDDECVEGLACSKSVCSTRKRPEETCERQPECAAGLICLKGRCFTPIQAGRPCAEQAECTAGLVCIKSICSQLSQENGPCQGDHHCLGGLTCLDGNCFRLRQQGGNCELPNQCAAGLECRAKACVRVSIEGERCAEDSECRSGLVCRKNSCFLPKGVGESCAEMDDCAGVLWCIRGKCSPPDETLEKLRAAISRWDSFKVADCTELDSLNVLGYGACKGVLDAVESGRTNSAGREAMVSYLRSHRVTRVRGFIVANVGDNLYEAAYVSRDYDWGIEFPTSRHFVLKMITREFYTTGAFHLWVERMPGKGIRTQSGGFETWDSYQESLVGESYQAIRDASAGSDTREAAKAFIGFALMRALVERLLEITGSTDYPGR